MPHDTYGHIEDHCEPVDASARLLAEHLSNDLPQRVVVENRTGAGVVVGSDVVAKAPKDGNTLLYSTIAHSVLRALFPRLPFDPVADFQPVALMGVILWAAWEPLVESIRIQEYVGALGDFTAPVWPVRLIMLVGMVATLITFVLLTWLDLRRMARLREARS